MVQWKNLFNYVQERCDFKEENDKLTWDCDGSLKFTKAFCKLYELDFTRVRAILEGSGGYCDCEVIFNCIDRIDENEEI